MKQKKKKFKNISFKLSDKQHSIVKTFCANKKISPNKLFKSAIKEYILRNYDFKNNNYEISENQLDLFDLVEEIEGGVYEESQNIDFNNNENTD